MNSDNLLNKKFLQSKLLSDESLHIPIAFLNLSTRTRNVLNREKIYFVHQLKNLKVIDVFNWKNLGILSIEDLRNELERAEAKLSKRQSLKTKSIDKEITDIKLFPSETCLSKKDKLKAAINKHVALLNLDQRCLVSEISSSYKEERRKDVKELTKFLKKNYSIHKTAKLLNVSALNLRKLLCHEYNCNSMHLLKKKLKIKRTKRTIDKKKLERLRMTKEIYDKCHTLQKTADELHITRERVRQLLRKGEKLGLFKYELYKQKKREQERGESRNKLKDLMNNYDRISLINEIKMLISPSKICMKLNIAKDDFDRLLKHFNIDYQEYQRLARLGQCLAQYSLIVDTLGHHPTTTEMCSRKHWRGIWSKIDRYWGSIDKFRKEFGIEKPKFKIHPNTLIAVKKVAERKRLNKKERKEKMLNLIQREGPISRKVIIAKLGFKTAALDNYIKELLAERLLTRINVGKYAISE
ncbi:MAG: hypothetical protein JSV30_02985 [Candidatus Omnitrophota bacterium]|nr:MAG: hypothetical protein JSV30_02985 [Candidatus Omnitrophota bacterium]